MFWDSADVYADNEDLLGKTDCFLEIQQCADRS